MGDPLNPSAALLCKLGSVIVHADELLSPFGHQFDREAGRMWPWQLPKQPKWNSEGAPE